MIRSSRTAWKRIDGEVLIVSSDSNSLTILNDSAARVWELLDEGRSVDELAIAISDEFDVDSATARRDIGTFLADLRRRDLVLDTTADVSSETSSDLAGGARVGEPEARK